MDRSKWEYKKLGDICKSINAGGTPSRGNSAYWNGDIPWVKIKDMNSKYVNSTEEFITNEGLNNSSAKLFEPGTILYSIFATIGAASILKIPATTNQAIAGIVLGDGCNRDFYYYYLTSLKTHFENISKGVAQNNINLSVLRNQKVVVPPIEDQQRIVAELDCLNEMIAVKQEQLKEFDKLAQSIFYDMFGDDGGFDKVKLGDVVEVVSGLVNPNIEPYCSQLHVSPANIVSGTNEIVNCVKAKDERLISDKYPFEAGMVLYSKIRPNLNKVAVATFDGICSADMYPLAILPKANNVFITKLLSSKQFLEYAIKNSGRARMPKLNRDTLFSYSFKLPPLALQQQFAEKISAIEAQKELVKQSIAETQTLLSYTMDKYFG